MKLPYQARNEPKYMYDPIVSEQEVMEALPHQPVKQEIPCELPKSLANMPEVDIERKLVARFDKPFKAKMINRGGVTHLQVQEMNTKMLFRIMPEEFRLSNTSPLDRLYTRVQDRLYNEKKDNGI